MSSPFLFLKKGLVYVPISAHFGFFAISQVLLLIYQCFVCWYYYYVIVILSCSVFNAYFISSNVILMFFYLYYLFYPCYFYYQCYVMLCYFLFISLLYKCLHYGVYKLLLFTNSFGLLNPQKISKKRSFICRLISQFGMNKTISVFMFFTFAHVLNFMFWSYVICFNNKIMTIIWLDFIISRSPKERFRGNLGLILDFFRISN